MPAVPANALYGVLLPSHAYGRVRPRTRNRTSRRINVADTIGMQNTGLRERREIPLAAEVIMQGATAIQQLPTPSGADTRTTHGDISILGVPDLERLQLILDRALRVHARSHFFSWAQGILQALLPHQFLVCALSENQSQKFVIDVMTIEQMPARDAEFLRRPANGFVDELARNWKNAGRRPLAYQRGVAAANIDAALTQCLGDFSFENFVVHGMSGVDGSVSSLFILLNVPGGAGAREIYLFDTLLPFVHATWLRVHLGQARAFQVVEEVRRSSILSARELEVIRWVHDGKSNGQIGALLKISPLTVKNHVQKILRKLNVQNRTEAVSKSLALKIFDPSRQA
jgi:transcriptional regulator EpsA